MTQVAAVEATSNYDYQTMQRQCTVPSVITYSALTSAQDEGKQPNHAQEVLQRMQRPYAVPDTITCNALISACETGKQPLY